MAEQSRDQTTAHNAADRRWLEVAVELSRRCPPSATAYSVGAVVVDATGAAIASGYSRENDPRDHAEEAALAKIPPGDARLASATVYSSLEPCSARASRQRSCAELIVAAGIARVVFAWREPSVFVEGRGAEMLADAGVTVIEIPDLAGAVQRINAHLL
jgi:pyrimidine deaminase RibD-like protein